MFFTNRYSINHLYLCLIILLSACKSDSKIEVNLDGTEKNVEIRYFDQDFWKLDSLNFSSSLSELKTSYPDFFLNKDVTDKDWLTRFQDKKIQEFSDSLFQLFSDSSLYVKEINSGFKYFQYHFNGQPIPQIAFWFSNFEMETPIVSSRNTLFIAEEHFLGPNHSFYQGAPDYIKFDKQLPYLSTKVFLEWASRYNAVDMNDPTFLAKMIYEGKALYFAEQLLNLSEENRIIGYPKQDFEWSQKNEGSIWEYFINKDYLFSNDQKLLRRFIEPSPFSKFYTGNDNVTPGRIGIYIGWQIIKSYMEHNPEVSLSDLMKEKNAKKILNKSKYKPKI